MIYHSNLAAYPDMLNRAGRKTPFLTERTIFNPRSNAYQPPKNERADYHSNLAPYADMTND